MWVRESAQQHDCSNPNQTKYTADVEIHGENHGTHKQDHGTHSKDIQAHDFTSGVEEIDPSNFD